MDFEAFRCTIVDTWDKYAPLKKRYLRASHSNFLTKELSKAIMNRSRLRHQFLKNISVESRIKFNKERNICVPWLRKTKRKYCEDLRLSDDNKTIWKTVKSLLGNKVKCKSQIALVKVNNLATDGKILAEVFNKFFGNFSATLGIKYEKLPSNYNDSNYNLKWVKVGLFRKNCVICFIKSSLKMKKNVFYFKSAFRCQDI